MNTLFQKWGTAVTIHEWVKLTVLLLAQQAVKEYFQQWHSTFTRNHDFSFICLNALKTTH